MEINSCEQYVLAKLENELAENEWGRWGMSGSSDERRAKALAGVSA